MNEYIDRINKSSLPPLVKMNLKQLVGFVEMYEQMKAEKTEPNREWLQSKLREYEI